MTSSDSPIARENACEVLGLLPGDWMRKSRKIFKPIGQSCSEVMSIQLFFDTQMKTIVSNGRRTDWSPIRSVIIRVINKMGPPRS